MGLGDAAFDQVFTPLRTPRPWPRRRRHAPQRACIGAGVRLADTEAASLTSSGGRSSGAPTPSPVRACHWRECDNDPRVEPKMTARCRHHPESSSYERQHGAPVGFSAKGSSSGSRTLYRPILPLLDDRARASPPLVPLVAAGRTTVSAKSCTTLLDLDLVLVELHERNRSLTPCTSRYRAARRAVCARSFPMLPESKHTSEAPG